MSIHVNDAGGGRRRFTKSFPCPVCSGFDQSDRGKGLRCFGFLSSDGAYAHCSREDRAGSLAMEQGAQTFAHRLAGPCRCGTQHTPGVPDHSREKRADVIATYDYRATDGTPLYQVVRRADKTFRQRRSDGKGGWIEGQGALAGVDRILYRLPELLAADPSAPVFIVEGEKDADRLASLGMVATTNSGGAGKWPAEQSRHLLGRRVVIIPDNDEPGRQHVAQVVAAVRPHAASLLVLELPGLGPKGDVSDWLLAGGNAQQLLELAERQPGEDDEDPPPGECLAPSILAPQSKAPEAGSAPALLPLVRACDVPEPGPITWLAEGLWTDAAFGVVGALWKSMKSWFTLQLAISVALGLPFLDRFATKRGPVVIFYAEGGVKAARRRLGKICRAMGLKVEVALADVHLINLPSLRLDDPEVQQLLRATVEATRPVLVILDPLRELHGGDENDAAAMSALLAPLRGLQALGAAVMLTHHFVKPSEASKRRPAEMLRGSGVLAAAFDSAVFLSVEGTNENKRINVTGLHRDADDPEPFKLRLRGSLIDDSLMLEPVDGEAADEQDVERDVAERQRLLDKVLKAVTSASAPGRTPLKSKNMIVKLLGGRAVRVRTAVDELVASKAVHEASDGYRPGAKPQAELGLQ